MKMFYCWPVTQTDANYLPRSPQRARDHRSASARPDPGISFCCNSAGTISDARLSMIAGSAAWAGNDFNNITLHSTEVAFERFHENDLKQWYRLLLRSSTF